MHFLKGFLLVMSLSVSACGVLPSQKVVTGSESTGGTTEVSDADLALYANLFVTKGGQYGKVVSYEGFTIRFENLDSLGAKPGTILGTCDRKQFLVRINSSTWGGLSATEKEIVMFHELGHCVLGLDHDDTTHSSGLRPNSLMNSKLIDAILYRLFESDYLANLYQ